MPRSTASNSSFPLNNPAAVVLDMDGVIVDSEYQWRLAADPLFREVAPGWHEEDNESVVGLNPHDIYNFLTANYTVTKTCAGFLTLCDALARDIYTRHVTLYPGLTAFLARAKQHELPLALASSAPRSWIELVLERFRLAGDFAAIASGDETPGRAKPAPDLYLLAAKRLNLPPGLCLAVEDSSVGVRAAKAAGFLCAAYRNGHNDTQDLSAADFTFSDFAAFDYLTASSPLNRD